MRIERTLGGLCLVLVAAGCGKMGGAAARGAERGAARAFGRSAARVLERDAARDVRLVAKQLAKGRTVFRFTTRQQAAKEVKMGVKAGSHLTSRGGPGRPPSAEAARKRYGLSRPPEVRETIRLPRGQPTKLGKVIGGSRGVGEATSTKTVPADAVSRVVRVFRP